MAHLPMVSPHNRFRRCGTPEELGQSQKKL